MMKKSAVMTMAECNQQVSSIRSKMIGLPVIFVAGLVQMTMVFL